MPERGASRGDATGGGASGRGSRALQGQGTRHRARRQRVQQGIWLVVCSGLMGIVGRLWW